jgi:hypothetical protein
VTLGFRRVAVIGGDGVFGVHVLQQLLEQPDIGRVVSIGRNDRNPSVDSLDVRHVDAPSSPGETTCSADTTSSCASSTRSSQTASSTSRPWTMGCHGWIPTGTNTRTSLTSPDSPRRSAIIGISSFGCRSDPQRFTGLPSTDRAVRHRRRTRPALAQCQNFLSICISRLTSTESPSL